MKTKLSLAQAEKKLLSLKSLNDGKEYCMTLDPWAKGKNKFTVNEKTQAQKEIDASNNELANTKITDFIRDYDITKDLH
jgi:hypothetical protein